MVSGYFGVILPQQKFWQGFFIDEQFYDASESYLNLMRRDERFGPVPDPVPPGAAAPPFEGFVAALAAGLARSAGAREVDTLCVGVMGQAFARLVGLRYFIIVCEEHAASGGAMTHLEDMPNARCVEDARCAFGAHPHVRRFKREVFERELARFHFDKAGHA